MAELVRNIVDFLTGYYTARDLRKCEGFYREYLPNRVPYKEVKESIPFKVRNENCQVLLIDTIASNINKSRILAKYVQPTLTLMIVFPIIGYVNNEFNLKELFLIGGGLLAAKSFLQYELRSQITRRRKFQKETLEKLASEDSDDFNEE